MTDMPMQQSDAVSMRTEFEQMLREVVRDLVSADTVSRMVNTAVDYRLENFRQLVNGIDKDQRKSYEDYKGTIRDFTATNDRFNGTLSAINERLARSETGQDTDRKRLDGAFQKIDAQQQAIEHLEERLASMENAQKELRIDVHGDATLANRPSIFGQLKAMDSKLDTKFESIETSISGIKQTQDRHESYINRRKNIEDWAKSTVFGMWKNKISRYAILSGLPVIGTLFASTVDPRIGEAIAQIITSILTGK